MKLIAKKENVKINYNTIKMLLKGKLFLIYLI